MMKRMLIFVALLLASPALFAKGELAMRPASVHAAPKPKKYVLPPTLKRLVVLPLAADVSRPDLTPGCDVLGPMVAAELVRLGKFEAVPADPAILRSDFGDSHWTGGEALPPDFLESLQRLYGADAVVFCQLTEFRGFEPLAVGWRLKLVDLRNGKILWADDEILDARNPAVAAQVRRFYGGDGWLALNSPQMFGRFSLAAILATLPGR